VWQVIAIIALLAATAGWTTVGVIAVRPTSSGAAVDAPVASDDPNAVDPGAAQAVTHDAPELEALLPATLSGTPLDIQSLTGDAYLAGDAWGASVTSFLAGVGKLPADLHVAQAADPTGAVDVTINLFKAAGVEPAALRDALLAAWKGDNADMKTSTVTIGGEQLTKGDFGPDLDATFLYLHDGAVYDIETADPAIVAAALAAIKNPGASGAPVGSAAPAASGSPAP
jgi:hypothetical protein